MTYHPTYLNLVLMGVLSGLLLLPVTASGSVCEVPGFETFVPSNDKKNISPETIEVEMQPVATLMIPSGFSKMGALPYGSIVFGGHLTDITIGLSFESVETTSIHKKGVKPASFMLSIFKGLDAIGCEYLKAFQLESEDYRLHAKLDKNAELFAYGKGNRHQFYLIRSDEPDHVLSGLFRNMGRAEFETILSTIVLK